MLRRVLFLSCLVLAAAPAGAQTPAQRRAEFYRAQRVPFEPGFRVFIVPDMEGMGSVVDIHEIIAGNEGERYKTLTGPDYWGRFRSLLTQEVNATIRGARSAGARSFTVNEGHGGNLFANILPWELDSSATLVRGFPKPLVMITGLDSTFGTLMFTGAHANAGSPGVMPHNFAFDSFTVNGKRLNEVGINALMAGEMGVSVSLVAGDDVLLAETREILGYDFVQVLTKRAVGRSAAITYSPAKVRQMLAAGAAEAVRREQRGEFPAVHAGQAVHGGIQATAELPRHGGDAGGGVHRLEAREDRGAHLPAGHQRCEAGRLPAGCHRRGGAAMSRRLFCLLAALPAALAAQGQPPGGGARPPRHHPAGRRLRRHRVAAGAPEARARHAADGLQRLHHRRHGGALGRGAEPDRDAPRGPRRQRGARALPRDPHPRGERRDRRRPRGGGHAVHRQ
ncbi:MAG: M55 family metallopeptidase [Gemmatimonadetes bacterium]|nr:M55 family metallopeptidase [Gemmatimonadota bacterium]